MKITIFSLYYYPDKTGISVTSTELAEWLSMSGHDVTVVTGLPFYPEWQIDRMYRRKLENINGVTTQRVWLYVPRKASTITRILHEISFCIMAFIGSRKLDAPDVVIAVTPPLFLGFTAIMLARVWNCPVLLNVQDLVPDAAIELSMIRNKAVIHILFKAEKLLYHNVDKIATVGNGMLKRILGKGISATKVFVLPNTADPALLCAPVKKKATNLFLKSYKIDQSFIALHSGNIGVKQGVHVIIEAAKLLCNYDIIFCIIGDGAERERVADLARSYKLKNILFIPLQPRKFLADMYHAADVCLLTQKKQVVDIVVPSKLISMMAAGSCVVASVHPESEAAKIVEDANCGKVVTPEDSGALAQSILWFYNNRAEINIYRRNAKTYVERNFDRSAVMNDLTIVLTELTSFSRNNDY
jgi:colanic acid biosynthesis glycosyl transferase WcaI